MVGHGYTSYELKPDINSSQLDGRNTLCQKDYRDHPPHAYVTFELVTGIRNELVEGRWELWENEDVMFGDLMEEYLEYARADKAVSTSTISKYRIEAHLLPYFGDTLLSRITPQMVDDYKAMRIREGASPNTVNRELANLSHMLRMAVRWRYIDKNVVSSVDRMEAPEKPHRFLNQEEIRRLVEATSGSHIYPIIVTALHTGMRKSELLNLKWSDVEFDHGTVAVQAKENWHTKNYRSRVLQLTPMLYEVLSKQRDLQSELGFQSEYVFTYQGVRIKRGIEDSLRTAVRKADLQNVSLHTLRAYPKTWFRYRLRPLNRRFSDRL